MTRLLGLCGALRQGSTNRKLMRQAAAAFAADSFTEADLLLPLYNGDDEDATGIPPAVQLLADQIAAADAVIIASPEYNKSVTGVLKNALDWVSRTKGGPWLDKPVAIMSANAGRSGGERGQYALRLALTPFRPLLLSGPEVLVANSGAAFDETGALIAESYVKAVAAQMEALKRLMR
jgi:chromate reductase